MVAVDFQFSADQECATEAIYDWLDSDKQTFSLAGPAGSGKSAVVSRMSDALAKYKPLYMSPSAKAAWVLQQRGVPAVTLHSALMLFRGTVETRDGNEKPLFDERDGIKADYDPGLFIVDEASMVDREMQQTIESKGKRVLYVGDPYQLPPVGPDARLMHNPDALLTEVHRQAEGSGILNLATKIREGGGYDVREDSAADVVFLSLTNPRAIAKYALDSKISQVIVPFNNTRQAVNKWYRSLAGRRGLLAPGDRITCRFNDYRWRIWNGMQATVLSVTGETDHAIYCSIEVDFGGQMHKVPIQKQSIANPDYKSSERIAGTLEFDYGYAITCHASQGSQFPSVLVVDIPSKAWDMRRWRYTALTRAEKFLAIGR